MLYKFKSKAAGDLIMLEPNGRRVLEIIGKETLTASGEARARPYEGIDEAIEP